MDNETTGIKSFIHQEKFSMTYEFPNFEISEIYEEVEGEIKQKFIIPDRLSSEWIIGQSLNLPSSWRIRVRCEGTHAAVGLILQKCLRRREALPSQVFAKFRIQLVDNGGDVLHTRNWHSWEFPRRFTERQEHPMRDFLCLRDLWENQALLLQGNTLRLNCEGVLFSDLDHQLVPNFTDMLELSSPISTQVNKKFWKDQEFADVQIVIEEGDPILAHLFVLQGSSNSWRNLISKVNAERGPTDRYAILKVDYKKAEVTKMLEFIYTGKITDQNWSKFEEVLRLLKVAKEYQIKGMKLFCLGKVVDSMTIGNYADIVTIFESYCSEETPRFQLALQNFFLKNQKIILEMANFQELAVTNKDLFLKTVLCLSQTRLH